MIKYQKFIFSYVVVYPVILSLVGTALFISLQCTLLCCPSKQWPELIKMETNKNCFDVIKEEIQDKDTLYVKVTGKFPSSP